jgi:hypothetical protein
MKTANALAKQLFGAKYESVRKSLLTTIILFFAATKWSGCEIIVAFLCGCMACAVASEVYLMCGRKNVVLPVLWAAGILFVIVFVRQTKAVLIMALVSLIAAVLYLYFANAYEFYRFAATKKTVRHTEHTGSVFAYLTRYLMANKNYLVNTVGLCVIACFLPLLFGEFQGLNIFSLGLAILCLNTPICTLLSCDLDLEQALRILPGQAGRFCRRYCLFIFAFNGIVACVYLCSWKFINGGIGFADLGMVALFALQSAILSVILEWKYPLRNWKTESDLWYHPRKYLVPLVMMLLAVFVAMWTVILWIWIAVLLLECYILLYVTRG